jgi:hypothetical protein
MRNDSNAYLRYQARSTLRHIAADDVDARRVLP